MIFYNFWLSIKDYVNKIKVFYKIIFCKNKNLSLRINIYLFIWCKDIYLFQDLTYVRYDYIISILFEIEIIN